MVLKIVIAILIAKHGMNTARLIFCYCAFVYMNAYNISHTKTHLAFSIDGSLRKYSDEGEAIKRLVPGDFFMTWYEYHKIYFRKL